MYLKKTGNGGGLGERIGGYLIFSMLGYIYNKKIYTYWRLKKCRRGKDYPSNIFDYINFPSNLIFVSEEEYTKLNFPNLQKRGYVYHGFDFIPETVYKILSDQGHITCSYEEMLFYYRKSCNEMFYKKELPSLYKSRPVILHMRRGDKTKKKRERHNDRIKNIFNNEKIKQVCDNIIVTTRNNKDIKWVEDNFINSILKVNFSEDVKIRTLEEFFFYSHCKIIFQSVVQSGKIGGWSCFSYVPFQLGLALYPNDPPILISLSEEKENTRMTFAKKYVKRNLFNIYHWPIKDKYFLN